MISLKLILLALVVLIVLYLAGLSFTHRHNVLKMEHERTLSPCPQKPNCVYSGSTSAQHQISPLPLLDNDRQKSWQAVIEAIRQSGGDVLVDDGNYCHAVFTSGIFRFKDDVEVKLTETEIAIRSASRAGTSDLGANRKRVEKIRSMYTKKQGV